MSGVDELYGRIRRELGLDGGPSPIETTQLLPAVRVGENDHLITRTGNGLHPADPAVQPPQDPAWRADGDR